MNFKDLLPNGLPFFKKSTPSEAIFALEINPDKVAAALWLVQGTQLQVLNTAYTKYESQADLVEAATRVLDQALADLPYDPAKIFGLLKDYYQILILPELNEINHYFQKLGLPPKNLN